MELNEIKFAIIIGAMKSGTTALFSLLAQHPEICPSHIKEPQFFVKKDYRPGHFDEYLSLWDCDQGKVKYYLEASTSYSKMPVFANAAERMKEAGMNAKFIYIMRHPIKRIESQLSMAKVKEWRTFDKNNRVVPHIIDCSRYYYQIKAYYDLFPAEDILLLSFEDYTTNPEGTLDKIVDFLGIRKDFTFDFNKTSKHETLYYNYKKRPFLKYTKWFFMTIGYFFRKYSYFNHYFDKMENRLDQMVMPPDLLTEDEKKRITNLLKDDIRNLKEKYSFETELWNLNQK